MSCANDGSARSIDRAAQSMDLSLAQASVDRAALSMYRFVSLLWLAIIA